MTDPVRPRLRAIAASLRQTLECESALGTFDLIGTPAPPVDRSRGTPPTTGRHAPTRRPHSGPPRDRASAPPATVPPPPAGPTERPERRPEAPPSSAPPRPRHRVRVPLPTLRDSDLEAFAGLRERVAGCRACPLCTGRSQTVFGEGAHDADLVFCGEGPGLDEDISGRPFVGRAGELLSAMIEKGLRRPRGSVYILNAVKCRPPNNRTPTDFEMRACRPFLEEQLEGIAPRVIVTLGNAGTRAVLGDVGGITRIRGQVLEAFGARVVPTFHPAYLLRSPERKREAWIDLQLVQRLLAEPS